MRIVALLFFFGFISSFSSLNCQIMNWYDVGMKQSPQGTSGIGRIDHIAFDPYNSNIIFACSPWGGVFRSNNSGNSWQSINLEHKLEQPSSSFMLIDPFDPTSCTWYLASGNGDGPQRNMYQRVSKGIYRTTNSGDTWVNIGPHISNTCKYQIVANGNTWYIDYLINDIIQGPESRQHLLISTTCGIYETKNALAPYPTWTNIIPGNFGSLVVQPGNTNIIFCAEQFTENPKILRYDLNSSAPPIELDYSAQLSISNVLTRVVLRFSQNIAYSDNLFVFFNDYINDSDDYEGRILLFKISADDWVDKGPLRLGGINRFDALHIDNDDANVVYVPSQSGRGIGTPQVARNGLNDAEFLSFETLANGSVHVDQHFITQSPHDGSVWIANDGGVYTINNGQFEERMTNLAVSTIDDFDLAQMEDETRFVAGYQDIGNAVSKYNFDTDRDESYHFFSCDGRQNNYDPFDFNFFTGGCQSGNTSLYEVDFNSGSLTYRGTTDFQGTINFDESNAGVAFDIMNGRLLKSIDRGLNSEVWCPYNNLRAFAQSPSCPNIMYCFSNNVTNGKAIVYKSVVGGGNDASKWSTITFGHVDFAARSPIVNYENPDHLWVIGSQSASDWRNVVYSFNTKTNSLERFTDLKTNSPFPSWTATSIASIVQEYNSNQGIYVLMNGPGWGSDIYTEDILYTDLTMNSWVNLKDGLPNIRITGIKINNASQDIFASTFGRGMWKASLYCNSISGNYTLPLAYSNQSASYEGTIIGSNTVSGLITLRAGSEVVFNPGFETASNTDLTAFVKPCSTPEVLLKSTSEKPAYNLSKDIGNEITEEAKGVPFKIYPNPNNGQFRIIYDNSEISFNYKLYNLNGELLDNSENHMGDAYLDLHFFKKGMYIIYITSTEHYSVQKVLIK
jgi:hypothetical protein